MFLVIVGGSAHARIGSSPPYVCWQVLRGTIPPKYLEDHVERKVSGLE